VSALLLHTAEKIKEIRQLLDERHLSPRIKLAVGGAAFNIDRELARTVGADGTALNALGAVAYVRSLQGGR
jgi:methanogenic corrinoid protein MtbC1